MKSSEPEVALGDYTDTLTGFPFKSKDFSDSEGIRLVRGDNVSLGFLDWSNTKYWPKYEGSLKKYLLKENDVLVGMDGSRVGQNKTIVRQEDLPLLLVQRVARLRAKKGLLQNYLIFVILSGRFTRYVDSIKTGSAVPHISANQIADYRFYLPPLEEQKSISQILSRLTEKIELNKKINESLETMAQAIFKNWFIDFEPYIDELTYNEEHRKEIPGKWGIASISDIANIYLGGTPKTTRQSYWGGRVKWAAAKDVANTYGLYILQTEKTITEEGVKNSNARILPANTLVITARGTVGEIRFLGEPMAFNQTCYGFLPKEGMSLHYLFNALKATMQKMESLTYGTVFKTITMKTFDEIRVLKPPAKIVEDFSQTVEPIYNLIKMNEYESMVLAQIRDVLISKLLSGEMRAKVKIEKEIPKETNRLHGKGEKKENSKNRFLNGAHNVR